MHISAQRLCGVDADVVDETIVNINVPRTVLIVGGIFLFQRCLQNLKSA
ncbi:hypothetical protein REC12_14880 [Desulfosporosinus sp. PR]|nr:hypothetical protein [Desulfosporosinus sp. PR]